MTRGLIKFIVVVLSPLTASAIGLSYGDQQVFAHGCVTYNQTPPLALADYPFADIGKKVVFQTSYRQLYNMKELADSRAAAAVTIGHFNLAMAAASFGQSDYFHQMGLGSVISLHTGRFDIGAALIYHRIEFGGEYEYLSAWAGNCGMALQFYDLTLYSVARAINQPYWYNGSKRVAPEGEIGLSYATRDGLISQLRALFVHYQKPSAQMAQSFKISDYASVNWALVLLPIRFEAGLRLESGHFGFDYRFSHHPVLGPTHTVMLDVFK